MSEVQQQRDLAGFTARLGLSNEDAVEVIHLMIGYGLGEGDAVRMLRATSVEEEAFREARSARNQARASAFQDLVETGGVNASTQERNRAIAVKDFPQFAA